MKKENCKICNIISSYSPESKIMIVAIIVLLISNIVLFCKVSTKSINSKMDKYVSENTKTIINAFDVYIKEEQAKMQQEQSSKANDFLKTNKEEIHNTKNKGVANKKGEKVIVEFFDYNCGYCKMATETVSKIIKDDKNIKVIFVEMPILSEASLIAAKYATAIAMTQPEKYLKAHEALMKGEARDEASIKKILKDAGFNVFSLDKTLELKGAEIEKTLNENRELAQKLGLSGTPAFVIGDQFVPGFIEEATILELLNK